MYVFKSSWQSFVIGKLGCHQSESFGGIGGGSMPRRSVNRCKPFRDYFAVSHWRYRIHGTVIWKNGVLFHRQH
jgi:hypothetical protein